MQGVEDPLSWSRYAGLRPHWVIEGRIAVSPMPRAEDLDALASFPTVVSLAGPAEFVYGGGLDPRHLAAVVRKHIWLIVGEYNAPTLVELVSAVEEARDEPVLVHCLRGCGRSPMFAAAWLIRYTGARLMEALGLVAERRGCGVETLPQRSVLEAYDLARRAGLLGEVMGFDRDDPRPEYALLLSRSVSWLRSLDPVEEARRALAGRSGGIWEAASRMADALGYSVAGLRVDKEGGEPVLYVTVWVTRRAHPAAVKKPAEVPEGLEGELLELLRPYGVARVSLEARGPRDVPWV